MTDAELSKLKNSCHTNLAGHKLLSPAETFSRMADWCQQHQIEHDVYGEGASVQMFEQKVAQLLGMEAGLFCVTGTMTQATVLRLACLERKNPLVGLHATSHILIHERSNFQTLQHFQSLTLGQAHRPWTYNDIKTQAEPLAALQIELPMREIGGQLPAWDELEAIKTHCHEHDIHLHMDGARLWEAAAYYGKSWQEIALGFDTVYVSFYKGMAGLGGAMLLGKPDFLAKAKVWIHRLGGNIFRRTPYVVSAAMQFDERLAAMPAYFARTQQLFEHLQVYPQFRTNPSQPQANMLHVHLPVAPEKAIAIRNHIAQAHGIWLFNNAVSAALPNSSMFEWYVGDQLLNLDDQSLRRALNLFAAEMRSE
ncbi:threonine aldolase family protein [Undibacterium sp. SXout20W]|uniref:threonine aldolase family protein n=1 Tax=Undibacterium sp. SXout20W TaxID=3413051 RepID=UPI003BF0211A